MKITLLALSGFFGLVVALPNGRAQASAPGGFVGSVWGQGEIERLLTTPKDIGERQAWNLTRALDLASVQTDKIGIILTSEITALDALGDSPAPATKASIRQRAADQIRPLLTVQQEAGFNLIPQEYGGGLVGFTPEERVDRLDSWVHLKRAQKSAALKIYREATETLMENQAPEKIDQARNIRHAMKQEILALLEPKQRALWNAAENGDESHAVSKSSKIQFVPLTN
jgi:hypothetical protein